MIQGSECVIDLKISCQEQHMTFIDHQLQNAINCIIKCASKISLYFLQTEHHVCTFIYERSQS